MRGFNMKKGPGGVGKALPMKGGGKYAKAAVVKPQGFTDFSMPRDIYLPLGLIGLGLVMYFVQLKFFIDAELAESLGRMFLLVIIAGDVVVMFIAMLISLKFLGDTPGGLGTTALKFGAIALAPGALGEIVTIMVSKSSDTGGLIAGGLLTLALYATLVKVLFNLDTNTTGKIVGTIYIVRVWGRRILFIGLVALFAIMLVRGAGKLHDKGRGDEDAPRAKPATPEEQRKERDSEAQDALKQEGATEARAWAGASGHAVFNLGNETLPTIESLYKMGAKKVTVAGFADDPRAIGTVLVIELPTDPAAREPLFSWAQAQEKKLNPDEPDPPKDVGQKYIVVKFDNS
jgi:hypothetical protein